MNDCTASNAVGFHSSWVLLTPECTWGIRAGKSNSAMFSESKTIEYKFKYVQFQIKIKICYNKITQHLRNPVEITSLYLFSTSIRSK